MRPNTILLGVVLGAIAGAVIYSATRSDTATDDGQGTTMSTKRAEELVQGESELDSRFARYQPKQAPCVCRASCQLSEEALGMLTTDAMAWRAELEKELQYYLDAHVYMRGELDTDAVSWIVASILHRFDTSKVFAVDIGANVGQTSLTLQRAFNNADCRKLVKDVIEYRGPLALDICGANGRSPIKIVAFEPDPGNFDLCMKEAEEGRWPRLGWELHPYAVSSQIGQASFFISVPGSETSALFKPEGIQRPITVNVTTIDHIFSSPDFGLSDLMPFFLKIDTEGFDPDVLEGATQQLRDHRIKFIVFEYNHVWRTSVQQASEEDKLRKRLHTVVTRLHGFGYTCLLVGPRSFVPVTPPTIWLDKMEFYMWSNVFCGVATDPEFCEVTLGATPPSTKSFLQSYYYLSRQGQL